MKKMLFHYTEDQRRAMDTFVKITRAVNHLSSQTQSFIAHGLTSSQFGVLEALYHLGDLRQNELADKILKTSGNLTIVLDNLEKRDLVIRHRDKEDRRALRIALTPSGQELIAAIFPDHAEDIRKSMDSLSAQEQKQLSKLCQKLNARD